MTESMSINYEKLSEVLDTMKVKSHTSKRSILRTAHMGQATLDRCLQGEMKK